MSNVHNYQTGPEGSVTVKWKDVAIIWRHHCSEKAALPSFVWLCVISWRGGAESLPVCFAACKTGRSIDGRSSVMLQVINGNTQARLCNQPNESCEVKRRREKKEKGNITSSSANAAEIISSERRKVRIKSEMRELLAGSMWPGFGGLGRAGLCFQLRPGQQWLDGSSCFGALTSAAQPLVLRPPRYYISASLAVAVF